MRKGYWKILLRRLRSRVASGVDTFTFQHLSLTLTEVLASDDDDLESRELPLAATAGPAALSIDPVKNLVQLRAADDASVETTGLDLSAFIDALEAGAPRPIALEMSLGEVELLDLPMPQRDLLGD